MSAVLLGLGVGVTDAFVAVGVGETGAGVYGVAVSRVPVALGSLELSLADEQPAVANALKAITAPAAMTLRRTDR